MTTYKNHIGQFFRGFMGFFEALKNIRLYNTGLDVQGLPD